MSARYFLDRRPDRMFQPVALLQADKETTKRAASGASKEWGKFTLRAEEDKVLQN